MSDILNCEFLNPASDTQRCVFSAPVKASGGPAGSNDQWEFSILNCTSSLKFSKISCSSTALVEVSNGTSTFFWDKRISTFEFFTTFLFAVLILMLTFDFLYRFVYKIKVNFRH